MNRRGQTNRSGSIFSILFRPHHSHTTLAASKDEEEEEEVYEEEDEFVGEENDEELIARQMEEEAMRAKAKPKKEGRKDEDTPLSPSSYYDSLSPFKSSDIDVCFYGLSEPAFNEKVERLFRHLEKKVQECDGGEREGGRKVRIYRSSTNIILSALFPFRHIQISLVYVLPSLIVFTP